MPASAPHLGQQAWATPIPALAGHNRALGCAITLLPSALPQATAGAVTGGGYDLPDEAPDHRLQDPLAPPIQVTIMVHGRLRL